MFQNYKKEYVKNDILAGIIVALVSIPISMGYAQVAGLPVVYGLYGSLLPILIYALVTSSPQFVFGVDATPAALVGGTLATLGISAGSEEAMRIVPMITLATAVWLLLFYLVRAGKIVNYISTPVMGGFISGVGCTIILMQVSKLFGGKAGTGELFQLLIHIWEQFGSFHPLSAVLGFGTVALILLFKKISPKFPMSVVLMIVGALLTAVFHIDRYGVALLPQVESGLPKFVLPYAAVSAEVYTEIIAVSFSIALVIVAQTLLATNNYAMKYDYKISNNREVLAYAAGNLAGAVVGCCPINGSVSRTGIATQFGCKSQFMSLTAAATMVLVLLFGTDFLQYLPVPILTGIVLAALIGILEFSLARKLYKANKQEFAIFVAAFLGVLILGTIYGVVIGVILSFVAVIIKAVVPPKAFLGVIPGQEGFYSLKRNTNAHAIAGAVVYRFSGNLFFANINPFVEDIERAVTPETRCVIVDGSGMANIDITAADRLVILHRKMKEKGIRFYLTEHVDTVNDQLRAFGANNLLEEGAIRRTVTLALRDAGFDKPYPLEGGAAYDTVYVERDERLAEFEWAFGAEAEEHMEKLALEVTDHIATMHENLLDAEKVSPWGRIGLFDEDELLERVELHLSEMENNNPTALEELEERIEQRRQLIEHKLKYLNPEALALLQRHRSELAKHFAQTNPEAFAHLVEHRKQHIHRLEKRNPELAEKLKHLYDFEHGEK